MRIVAMIYITVVMRVGSGVEVAVSVGRTRVIIVNVPVQEDFVRY